MAYGRTHRRNFDFIKDKNEITMGEIKIDFKENEIPKKEELYYVIYTYKFRNIYSRKDELIDKPNFHAVLKNTLYNSYIFKNVSKYENIKSHKNCSLTVPIDWVDMIEIYKLFPKLPSAVVLHEILNYL
jgi:hypothetical protein